MLVVVGLLAWTASMPIQENVPGFEARTCKDRLGRKIQYYIAPAKPNENRPLALIILGSGGQSIWVRRGDRVAGGLQNLFLRAAKDSFRVLVVEKPGVRFGFEPPQPGTAIGCAPEFLTEHTHSRWSEANAAALRDAWRLPGADGSRTLVVGHSEGAMVAATVSRIERRVSHVAMLSGGGANPLFDLALLAERAMPGASASIYAEWEKIRMDPESTSRFAWGHPYRYWSNKLTTSPLHEALQSRAKLFAASGTQDGAVPIESFEVLRSGLVAAGREATLQRIEGADHGFEPLGFEAIFDRVIKWAQ